MRYYLDTCIWRDFLEDRKGPGGRPLGAYAGKLLMKLAMSKKTVIYSDITLIELRKQYSFEEITTLLNLPLLKLKKVKIVLEEDQEARLLAKARTVPVNDALHAILARDNRAIVVTQDKHFQQLKDIVEVKRPEDLI